jgi:hypothetical protein
MTYFANYVACHNHMMQKYWKVYVAQRRYFVYLALGLYSNLVQRIVTSSLSTLFSSTSRIMFDSVCSMHSTITWFIQICIGIFFAVLLDAWCFLLNQRKSIYHKSMTYIANYVACHNQGCKTIGNAEAQEV